MFAQTQDLEFGQGQSRDVPDRELGPNTYMSTRYTKVLIFYLVTLCHNSHVYNELKTLAGIFVNL